MSAKKEKGKDHFQLIGWYIIAYLIFCMFTLNQFVMPLAFVLWAFLGWSATRRVVDLFVVGDETVKKITTIAGFIGVLGLISLISAL